MNKYIGIAALVAIVLLVAALFVQDRKLSKTRDERDRYKTNTETLLSDVERFRVRDSLSAARVQSLELTVQEFERFRAEDAALIQSLKQKNRDLSAVNTAQSQTIIELSAVPHDTVVVVRDSIQIPAIALHCGDIWFDFDGYLTDKEFTGTLVNRDSLLLAETVKYRRFLGFLWKTRKIDERTLQAVSKNPHTQILGLEHVIIEK